MYTWIMPSSMNSAGIPFCRAMSSLRPRGICGKCVPPHASARICRTISLKMCVAAQCEAPAPTPLSFALQGESHLQSHLIMVHAVIAYMAANLHDLEPAQIPQGLRGARDR